MLRAFWSGPAKPPLTSIRSTRSPLAPPDPDGSGEAGVDGLGAAVVGAGFAGSDGDAEPDGLAGGRGEPDVSAGGAAAELQAVMVKVSTSRAEGAFMGRETAQAGRRFLSRASDRSIYCRR